MMSTFIECDNSVISIIEISIYAARTEQHVLKFTPAMSDDDFISYLKNEGLKEIDCSKLSGNW